MQIFEHLLISRTAICWPAKPKKAGNDRRANGDPELMPAILRVSRAVFSEAVPILYSRNTFTFPHPSDANMFRVIASPNFGNLVSRVQLAVRERDVHLWSAYLGSARVERSLQHDYPNLRALRIAFPSTFWSPLRGELSESYFRWQNDPRLREICLSLEHKFEFGVVKVVCAHALPEQNVRELVQSYPAELWADEVGVVRLKQTVKLFNAIVGLELIPVRAG
jgi:hypothetical protein